MNKKILGLMLVFVILTVTLGCGSTPTQPTTTPGSTTQTQTKTYSIGTTLNNKIYEFTFNGARWDKGTSYFKPKANEKWLIVDCTVKNISNETQNVSSMLMFDLYDANGYSKDMSWTADTNGKLDGEIQPGKMIRGEIAYVVDINDKGPWELTFDFAPLSSGGQAIYTFYSKDVK